MHVRLELVVVAAVALTCGGSEPHPTSAPEPTSTRPTPTPPSVTFDRIDSGPECNGLVPDRVPTPITITRTPPSGFTCAGGFSDGTGHVAVAARKDADASWQAFAPDGTAEATFTGWPGMPEPSGWHVLQVSPVPGPNGGTLVQHVAIGPDGSPGTASTVSWDPTLILTTGWSAAPDPHGGGLVIVAGIDISHNHWSLLAAQRFDAAGAPRWPGGVGFGARSERVFFLAGGVSRTGEVLVLWQQSAWLDVAWFDRSGHVLSETDLAERSADVLGSSALQHDLELVPLLDGGIAVRADGAFRRVYANDPDPLRAATSAPLPPWLAARATWTYRLTRGNAGYALFPPPRADSSDCTQAIELVAASGRRCGRVVLHGDGKPCSTGAVDQGWDGTVVQQAAADACTYRFWPGLLAGP